MRGAWLIGPLTRLHAEWWMRTYGRKEEEHSPIPEPVCETDCEVHGGPWECQCFTPPYGGRDCDIRCEAVGGGIGCRCIENPAGGRWVGATSDPGCEED